MNEIRLLQSLQQTRRNPIALRNSDEDDPDQAVVIAKAVAKGLPTTCCGRQKWATAGHLRKTGPGRCDWPTNSLSTVVTDMRINRFAMWLKCISLLLLVSAAVSEAAVEVPPSVRSSVEDFLRSHSHLRVDDSRPFKMSRVPKHHHRFSKALEMAEEALRAVYHELYEAANATLNSTDAMKRSRSLSARQSFFSNGLSSASEYMMSLVENSLEEIPSLPRLEAQECMKRSVCEAHNQPKKYGLIGLILQLLFPPYTAKSDESNNVVSKYQLAARYGRQSNANCGVQYDGCMLNLLDIVQALVNAFIR